jgi:hypothetical protein
MYSKLKKMKNKLMGSIFLIVFFTISNGFTTSNSIEISPQGGAYLTFAGKFGGELTKKDLRQNNKVKVSGCAKGSRIFKFTLHIVKKGKKSTFRTSSSNLTKKMIAQLRTLSKGDKFYFKNVEAYLPNGKDKVDVHSREFRIKN